MAWRLLLNAARDTSTQGADLGSTSGLAGCVAMFDSAVIEANLVLAAPLSTSNLKDLSAAYAGRLPALKTRNATETTVAPTPSTAPLHSSDPSISLQERDLWNPSLFYRV